jgi:hypothetical protein
MRMMKETLPINTLTGGVSCLKNFFNYVKGLNPTSDIDYELIRRLFKTESEEEYCFEFCKEKCLYKLKRLGKDTSTDQKES